MKVWVVELGSGKWSKGAEQQLVCQPLVCVWWWWGVRGRQAEGEGERESTKEVETESGADNELKSEVRSRVQKEKKLGVQESAVDGGGRRNGKR